MTQTSEFTDAPHNAAANLLREEKRNSLKAAGCLVGGVAGAAFALTVFSFPVIWGLVIAAPLIALFFMLTASRARSIRRNLGAQCRRVVTVGWSRAPDGCNFAVFPLGGDPKTQYPEFVLRLATVRETETTEALLADAQSPFGKVAALFANDGEVLAVGRIRERENGFRVWSRRDKDTPWWSMNPGRNSPPSE